MANALQLGNQKCLINFDEFFQIRDIFYPYVGEENHLYGHVHKFGLFVDGRLYWTDQHDFQIQNRYEGETLIGSITISSEKLGIVITVRNTVHPDKTVYIAQFEITNQRDQVRTITAFFRNDFHIYGHTIGDTAYFDPVDRSLIHYKGRRYFWSNANCDNTWGWHDFACGQSDLAAGISTSIDAQDGALSRNPVAHGRVDSTGGITIKLQPNGTKQFFHCLIMAQNYHELGLLKQWVVVTPPDSLYTDSVSWTRSIMSRATKPLGDVEDVLQSQYSRSLLTMITQSDQNGAIIAACDSHFLHGYDTYSYSWPRDGAFVSDAYIQAGLTDVAKNFFEFCAASRADDGYLLQKYNADGSYGSSWHPRIDPQGQPSLPIQEDSTATVLWAIGRYGEKTNDTGWLTHMWHLFIKDAADFLVSYRDSQTNLPLPSWDLWEERRGISMFTTCSVIAGLEKCAVIAKQLGQHPSATQYHQIAKAIKEAMLVHLYNPDSGHFVRMISKNGHGYTKDTTIDASLLAPVIFDILPSHHPKVQRTVTQIIQKLSKPIPIGGVARYENDQYFLTRREFPGNPWLITTFWLTQWYIHERQLDKAEELLDWVTKYQSEAGYLPEQLDPIDGRHLSVSPLTWSHGEYVRTFLMWMKAKYS